MEQFSDLLRQLKETGKNIIYYQDQVKRPQEAWTEIDDLDNKLRSLKDLDKSDEYLTSHYYFKIQVLLSKYISLMECELEVTSKWNWWARWSLGKIVALFRQLEDL